MPCIHFCWYSLKQSHKLRSGLHQAGVNIWWERVYWALRVYFLGGFLDGQWRREAIWTASWLLFGTERMGVIVGTLIPHWISVIGVSHSLTLRPPSVVAQIICYSTIWSSNHFIPFSCPPPLEIWLVSVQGGIETKSTWSSAIKTTREGVIKRHLPHFTFSKEYFSQSSQTQRDDSLQLFMLRSWELMSCNALPLQVGMGDLTHAMDKY